MKIHADHTTVKHLGHWTTDRRHEIRVRRGIAVLDLRSSRIPPGDLELHLDVDHGLVKLLLPNDAAVDQWDLQWTGRAMCSRAYLDDLRRARRTHDRPTVDDPSRS